MPLSGIYVYVSIKFVEEEYSTMRPAVRLLKTKSRKCFFSFPYNMTSFQTGYLGIGPSKISGGFHLRYPSSNPIHISRIDATLVGQEAMSFFLMMILIIQKIHFILQHNVFIILLQINILQ
uniref:Uncharacterized protein n=1 Tax=Rhizophagus irregularis (strain DAOM 181602 / DAOM 197198 / MUCL 43194) TaxID=747089 RepID=U9U7W8_RHIID